MDTPDIVKASLVPEVIAGVDIDPKNATELDLHVSAVLERIYPVEQTETRISERGTYTSSRHSQACRLAFLGMSDSAIASTIGVGVQTLLRWKEDYPKFAYDIHQAKGLAMANAALRLQQMMLRDDSVGLQATKFFLERRCDDFTDRRQVEVTNTNQSVLVAEIRRQVYGLADFEDDGTVLDATNSQNRLEANPEPQNGPEIDPRGMDDVLEAWEASKPPKWSGIEL